MRRSFLGSLFNRKRDAKARQLHACAEAVCAVLLGAQVRRLDLQGTEPVCEIDGFDDLPLFSKLVIWSVGRPVTAKTGSPIDDDAALKQAAALVASVAPSRAEADKLRRLALDEAGRIVEQRWTLIRRLAAILAGRGELAGADVARIVLRSATPPGKRQPRRAASRLTDAPRASPPRTSWMAVILARCAAAFGGSAGRAGSRTRARARKSPGRPPGRATQDGRQASDTTVVS
jgi:hypothetical protein